MGGLNAKMPSAFATKEVIATPDGYVTVKRNVYLNDVAQDLPPDTADFLAAIQVPTSATVYGAPTIHPAWRHKPAFGIVATQDRTVNPDLERYMYKWSSTQFVEVRAGHMVLLSQPRAVANIIIKAAQSAN